MESRRRPLACFASRLVALFLATPLPAHADPDSLQAITGEMLDFVQSIDPIAPVEGQVNLYVGAGPSELMLRSISLWVDGAPTARYEYSLAEANALQQSALHLLARLDPGPGAHTLRAEIIAVRADAPAYGARTRLMADWTLPQGNGVEIDFTQSGTLKKPVLQIRSQVAEDDNVLLRTADFLAADERDFDAAALLLQAQRGTSGESSGLSLRLDDALRRLGLEPRVLSSNPHLITASPIETYNRALTLIADKDHVAEGVAALTALGSGDAPDETSRWLRDRANLSLGAVLLREGRNDAAIQAYRLVRSPGPFSSRALLGYGWACLLTADTAQRPHSFVLPGSDQDIAELRRRVPFRRMDATATKKGAEDLRRALIPWTELIGRDPLDAAVQEGMLVVPYALTHLGAQTQAYTYYTRAVAALEKADRVLDQARAAVNASMIPALDRYLAQDGSGWHWQLADLAPDRRWWLDDAIDPKSLFYAGYLVDDDGFSNLLLQYRNAHLLQQRLQARISAAHDAGGNAPWLEKAVPLQRRISSLIARSAQDLKTRALAVIEQRQQKTSQYLAEAHLALARYNDPAVRISSR